jgi:hypothetical protein
MKPLLKLLPFARGMEGLILLTLAISLLVQGVTVVVPFVAGQMVREAVELRQTTELPRLTLLILGLFTCSPCAARSIGRRSTSARASGRRSPAACAWRSTRTSCSSASASSTARARVSSSRG